MKDELDLDQLEKVESAPVRTYEEAKETFEEKFGKDPTEMTEAELRDIQAGRPVEAVPELQDEGRSR